MFQTSYNNIFTKIQAFKAHVKTTTKITNVGELPVSEIPYAYMAHRGRIGLINPPVLQILYKGDLHAVDRSKRGRVLNLRPTRALHHACTTGSRRLPGDRCVHEPARSTRGWGALTPEIPRGDVRFHPAQIPGNRSGGEERLPTFGKPREKKN